MTRLWYRLKVFAQVVASRLRVHAYRLQGGRHIHSKCVFGQGVCVERPWLVTLGERCMLQRNVWLNVGADSAELEIGAYTFLGRGVEIEVSRAVRIGRGGLIAPGVFITDHNHRTGRAGPMFEQPCDAAPVSIGDDVWIGANAVILPGVTIGEGAVIGAGAVVSRDVPPYAIACGVPARVLRYRE